MKAFHNFVNSLGMIIPAIEIICISSSFLLMTFNIANNTETCFFAFIVTILLMLQDNRIKFDSKGPALRIANHLGKLSLPIYTWQFPVAVFLQRFSLDVKVNVVLYILITLAIAYTHEAIVERR